MTEFVINFHKSLQLVANQMANMSLNNGPPLPPHPTSQLPPQQQAALKQMPQQINRGFPPNNNSIPPNASQPLSPSLPPTAALNGLAQQNQHFVSNGSNQNYPTPTSQQMSPSAQPPPLPQQPRPKAQSEYSTLSKQNVAQNSN